jgi:hypothetical protein
MVPGRTIAAKITVAQVVAIDQNDIGFVFHKVARLCAVPIPRSRVGQRVEHKNKQPLMALMNTDFQIQDDAEGQE